MVAAVCHYFISDTSNEQLDYIPMMRQFTLTACMYAKPFQEQEVREIQLSLEVFTCILKSRNNEELFFHILCAMGKLKHISYILDVVSVAVREKLFQTLDRGRSPLFYAAVNGHMDVVSLLIDRGCPVPHSSPVAYLELNSLLPLGKKLHPLYKDEHKLYGKRLSRDIIQLFAAESDCEVIMNFTDCFCVLLMVALLPKLDIAQPTLKGLLNHLEPSRSYSCDFKIVGNALGTDFAKVQDKVAVIIPLLPKPSASSQESVDLMSIILSKIITWKLKEELVSTACEKGLWMVVLNSLSAASHNDKLVLHILNHALKQRRQDCFILICNTLRDEGRHFNKGFPEILSRTVQFRNASVVELLLELGGEKVDLISPFSLAVLLDLHSVADLILTKIASESSSPVTHLHKAVQVAVRYKNYHVIKLLKTNMFQSSTEEKSFWTVVLSEATKWGHEDLALEAISSLTRSQLHQIQSDGRQSYIQTLGWCCYWGMTDALNCLPFSTDMFFPPISDAQGESATSNGFLSPWCLAQASGRLGELAYIHSLDLSLPPPAVTEREARYLTLGVFSKFVFGNKESEACHNFNWYPDHCRLLVFREAYFGCMQRLETFFEHLGTYKKLHFEFICEILACNNFFPDLLTLACSRKNNFPAVQLILKKMADSGLNFSSHPKLKKCFLRSIKLGEVSYTQTFMLCIPNVLLNVEKVDMLTHAILSKNSEMVDYILHLLGDSGPCCCLQEFHPHRKNPLCTAFSFGCSSVILNSSLLSVASRAKEFNSSSREYASSCTGWFNLMMENNSRALSSNVDLNIESSNTLDLVPNQISLRKISNSDNLNLSLLRASTSHQVHSMTEAIIQASGGIIPWTEQKEMLEVIVNILLDKTVHNFMSSRSYCMDVFHSLKSKAEELDVMSSMLNRLFNSYGYEDKIIQLLHLFHPLSNDPDICKSALLNSCKSGKSKVVRHLLSVSDFGEDGACILQTGATTSAENGHFDIAADLMLKLNITSIEIHEDHTWLHQLIFSNPNYFTILDNFFSSLIDPMQRMPLAALWLVYNWSEAEAELVVHQLGSTYAPPNPWLLPRGERDMTITIDWDSFSESLLTSPGCALGHDNSGSSHYVPLVVEATVFTQAVLGQLVPSSFASGKAFQQNPREADFCSVVQSLWRVILTCTVWPTPPSFSLLETTHGILTVTYQPSTQSFIFPDLVPTSNKSGAAASDCPEHVLSTQTIISETFNDLFKYYKKKIKTLIKHNCRACVSVGDGLTHEIDESRGTDGNIKCDLYHTLASIVLQDIFNALELTLVPNSSPPALRLEKNVASSIEIVLDCNTDGWDQSVLNVSLTNSVLSIVTYLPCGDFSPESSEVCGRFFYNKLVEDMREVLLREHAHQAQHNSKIKMKEMVASILVASLCLTSVPDVVIHMSPEDVIGESTDAKSLNPVSAESLVLYVKYVNKLQLYLKYFCKMLKDFHHLPELRTSFGSTFTVTLTQRATSPILEMGWKPNLVVPIKSLQTKKHLYDSLLHTFQGLIPTLYLGEHISSQQGIPALSVPAPTACHIKYHESQGLLFPVQGVRGTITIQMVAYNGHHLQDYHTETATLKVRIRHLKSKSITNGSSSTSTPHRAERWLLVKTDSNGTFVIQWTPQNVGLHSIHFLINGINIDGSPHRCFCASPNRLVKGTSKGMGYKTDAVFVVEHLSECSLATKPLQVKLYNKKLIRPLASPPGHKCSESFISELLQGDKLIHHISLISAYGGARNWICLASGAISVHILKTDEIQNSSCFRMCTISLANGLHYVTMASNAAVCFSVLASCSLCQSLMKVHCRGESSVCPTSISTSP